MSAHTPGPWEIREVAHGSIPSSLCQVYRVEICAPQYLYGKRTHSRYIANIVDYTDWTDQPANARLIAAAPDLLAACRMVCRAFTLESRHGLETALSQAYEDCKAAITKAECVDPPEGVNPK